MSSIAPTFFAETQRVTAHVYYFIPRKEGSEPLEIKPRLLGQRPTLQSHTGVLQSFIYQCDATPDLHDQRLKDVFEEVINMSGGILKIHDRKKRISIMTEEAHLAEQNAPAEYKEAPSIQVPQIFIPTKEEEASAGMKDVTMTFKTLVPFPQLRKFLQHWQAMIDGPMHHIEYVGVKVSENTGFQKGYHIN